VLAIVAFATAGDAIGAAVLLALPVVLVGRRFVRGRPLARETTSVIAVLDGGLVIRSPGREARVPAGAIASGHVVPEDEGATVVLEGDGRIAEAWLPTIEDARALLAELGLSPLERPSTFAFAGGLRVTVGTDGVVVAWPLLGRRRFVPHRSIEDVRWTSERVTLVRKEGHFDIMTGVAPTRQGSEAQRALVERLLQAREAYRASTDPTSPAALLSRSGRSLEGWVKALRGGRAAGYRSAHLPEDVLWRIALSPAEQEELRIGASLALREGLDVAGRERLRVAAEAAASPRVRVALAAAAEEEDDDVLARKLAPPPRG
jgi:hypothetical protein